MHVACLVQKLPEGTSNRSHGSRDPRQCMLRVGACIKTALNEKVSDARGPRGTILCSQVDFQGDYVVSDLNS